MRAGDSWTYHTIQLPLPAAAAPSEYCYNSPFCGETYHELCYGSGGAFSYIATHEPEAATAVAAPDSSCMTHGILRAKNEHLHAYSPKTATL
jgi:hypothetical protein